MAAAFVTWQEHALQRKHHRQRGAAALAHMLHRGMGAAFATWRARAAQRHELLAAQADIQVGACRSWHEPAIAPGWLQIHGLHHVGGLSRGQGVWSSGVLRQMSRCVEFRDGRLSVDARSIVWPSVVRCPLLHLQTFRLQGTALKALDSWRGELQRRQKLRSAVEAIHGGRLRRCLRYWHQQVRPGRQLP